MDIEGLGEALIENMVNSQIINSVSDLYYLKESDVIQMERMGPKLVDNILQSIENSKNNELSKLIFGLGIRGIGQRASKCIAEKFKDIELLFDLQEEDLLDIDGIGEVMAKNLRLKAARAALDLSQDSLAKKVGVTRQTINAVENGDYNPTINLCVAICKALGKTLDELFWEEEDKK